MLIEDHGNIVSLLLLLRPPKDATDMWLLGEVALKIQELASQYENAERLGSVLPEHSKVGSSTKLC